MKLGGKNSIPPLSSLLFSVLYGLSSPLPQIWRRENECLTPALLIFPCAPSCQPQSRREEGPAASSSADNQRKFKFSFSAEGRLPPSPFSLHTLICCEGTWGSEERPGRFNWSRISISYHTKGQGFHIQEQEVFTSSQTPQTSHDFHIC